MAFARMRKAEGKNEQSVMYTQENLNKVTGILLAAGLEKWPMLCRELNIRDGRPDHVIVDWKYGSKPTADHYEFKSRPRYDQTRNVVVVENPWSTLQSAKDPELPVLGPYIEIDAEVAMKILILGVP